MIKNVLAIMVLSLLFTSCGGSAPQAVESSMLTTSTYSISIFPGWVQDKEHSTPSYEIYVSPSPKDGIFSSLTILREELLVPQTSKDYAMQNIAAAERDVRDYVAISSTASLIDGIPSLIHIFDGRSSSEAVRKRFLQAYVTDGQTKAFTISFAISPNTTDTTIYSGLLESFKLK